MCESWPQACILPGCWLLKSDSTSSCSTSGLRCMSACCMPLIAPQAEEGGSKDTKVWVFSRLAVGACDAACYVMGACSTIWEHHMAAQQASQ